MTIQKIKIEEFIELAKQYPVLDVRSPDEYGHAHIPGAYNLPLFTDEERKIVGTTYKQQNREAAIKIGLEYFGVKMRKMVEEAEAITKDRSTNTVLVHCWRGGMRSAGVAWLLDLYGFKVYTLTGGYKAYRNWVLAQFEKQYPLQIIGGYTGSGKTLVLKELHQKAKTVIDLEAIAAHKGSAFGGFDSLQPRAEMFENMLAIHLYEARESTSIWLEDESQRIGDINLPAVFWKQMRTAPVFFLDLPFEERLNYITAEYGKYAKEKLVNAIIRIQKRLGGLDTKNAVNFLLEDNIKECFRILLRYYDKFYEKSLHNRENLSSLLHTVACDKIDIPANTNKILDLKPVA